MLLNLVLILQPLSRAYESLWICIGLFCNYVLIRLNRIISLKDKIYCTRYHIWLDGAKTHGKNPVLVNTTLASSTPGHLTNLNTKTCYKRKRQCQTSNQLSIRRHCKHLNRTEIWQVELECQYSRFWKNSEFCVSVMHCTSQTKELPCTIYPFFYLILSGLILGNSKPPHWEQLRLAFAFCLKLCHDFVPTTKQKN